MTNEQLQQIDLEKTINHETDWFNDCVAHSEGQLCCIDKKHIRGQKIRQYISYLTAKIEKAKKEAVGDTIGEIGAKLLAKHTPQAVLDAYFDTANEVLENDETNN